MKINFDNVSMNDLKLVKDIYYANNMKKDIQLDSMPLLSNRLKIKKDQLILLFNKLILKDYIINVDYKTYSIHSKFIKIIKKYYKYIK